MRQLLLTTAIVAASGVASYAQTQDGASEMFRSDSTATEVRASDFIGMRIFAASTAPGADAMSGDQDNWEDIGEINDVILSRDGSIEAVLVDIGGFLGIGERQIAVNMSAIDFVSDASTEDEANDYFLVLTTNRESLEGAPTYGTTPDPAAETTAATEPQVPAAEDTAAAETEAQPAEDMAATEAEEPATEDTASSETEEPATEDTAAAETEAQPAEDMAATETEEPATENSASAETEEPASEDTAAAETEA